MARNSKFIIKQFSIDDVCFTLIKLKHINKYISYWCIRQRSINTQVTQHFKCINNILIIVLVKW